MIKQLEPLRSASLKDVFIERFEELIFSGALGIGDKLPPERALASQLGVSRPVVHEGLVELSARGLVTMTPRVGTIVNDYRKEGSVAALNSLINHRQGSLSVELVLDLLALRRVIETETTRLAARARTREDVARLVEILDGERDADPSDPDATAERDFAFHHQIAMASKNKVYPMLLKSFEPTYRCLGAAFYAVPGVVDFVLEKQAALVTAIDQRDPEAAVGAMNALLDHGHDVLTHAMHPVRKKAVGR